MTSAFKNKSGFATDTANRYFEDYIPGSIHKFGEITVSEAEIVDFASKFDPQLFHLDPDKARNSLVGGLIASGFHTSAITMRLLVDHYLSQVAGLESPGLDTLRWLKPVRPGDRLWVRLHIVDTRKSKSKPDRGIVTTQVDTFNQHDEQVMAFRAMMFVRCRN